MCSENSRSQIAFRTDIFRKLTLGAPVKWLSDNFVGLNSGNWFTSLVESTLNGTARHSIRRENGLRLSEPHFIRKQAVFAVQRWDYKCSLTILNVETEKEVERVRPSILSFPLRHCFQDGGRDLCTSEFSLKKKRLLRRLGKVCLQ